MNKKSYDCLPNIFVKKYIEIFNFKDVKIFICLKFFYYSIIKYEEEKK